MQPPRAVVAPDQAARRYLEVIRPSLKKHETPSAAATKAWLDLLEGKREFTVFEHSTLTMLLAQNVFPHGSVERTRISALLVNSWNHLTGRAPENLVQRLPLSAIWDASRYDKIWHAAAFIPLDTSQDRLEQRRASSLVRDWIPTPAQLAIGASALAVGAMSAIGAQVLLGLAVMHPLMSMHEFGVHRVMHPWKSLREWIKKGPKEDASAIEKKAHAKAFPAEGPSAVADTLAEHDVHHFWTYDTFTEMFSKMPQEKVDALIDRRYSPKHAKKIKADKYASALTWKDIIKLSRTTLPQTVIAGGAFVALGVPWALVGVAAYFVAYPVATGLVHGHAIHLTKEKREKASWWVRAIADTAMMHWATSSHFIHHQSVNDTNFNVCFPGADAWFGTYAQPNMLDLMQMDEEKAVYA